MSFGDQLLSPADIEIAHLRDEVDRLNTQVLGLEHRNAQLVKLVAELKLELKKKEGNTNAVHSFRPEGD